MGFQPTLKDAQPRRSASTSSDRISRSAFVPLATGFLNELRKRAVKLSLELEDLLAEWPLDFAVVPNQ